MTVEVLQGQAAGEIERRQYRAMVNANHASDDESTSPMPTYSATKKSDCR